MDAYLAAGTVSSEAARTAVLKAETSEKRYVVWMVTKLVEWKVDQREAALVASTV